MRRRAGLYEVASRETSALAGRHTNAVQQVEPTGGVCFRRGTNGMFNYDTGELLGSRGFACLDFYYK
jgi:hypothetical protein